MRASASGGLAVSRPLRVSVGYRIAPEVGWRAGMVYPDWFGWLVG